MTVFSVGYFVGSLAKNSINRKLATALTSLAPAELTMREIPIRDLPLFPERVWRAINSPRGHGEHGG